jgi:hypothetical protein
LKKIITTLTLLASTLLVTSCSEGTSSNANSEAQQAITTGFDRLQKSQPVPVFDYSAIRQTVIDVQNIQANGVITTTSFYLEGVGLVHWCPSKGLPVPSTYQLTGSTQYVDVPGDRTYEKLPVDQGESIGLYVGNSNGTNVICLDDNGKSFLFYWEGPVGSTSGVIQYPEDKRVRLNGDPSYKFK